MTTPTLISRLQYLKGWRLRTLVSASTAVATELIVSVMDFILKGHVTTDTLLTGLVAVCFVSPSSLHLMEFFLDEFDKQQREREIALQKAHTKLLDNQFAMESVGIAIHWIDAESGQFLYANRFAAELLGFSVDEMLSLNMTDIDPNLQTIPCKQAIEILRQQDGVRFETVHRSKDGRIIPVEITSHFQNARTDTPARFISFVTDISRRKETEQALVRSKEAAEAANIAKSTFIATMSHELRTPLNSILGFSELMSRDQAITASQKQTLEIINRSGTHLLSMINDVLDISKIEAGHCELDIQAFDLHILLKDIADMISVRAVDKHLSFKSEISPDIPQYIKTDSGKLRQILINLLGNAIKFTQQGGVILRANTQPITTDMMLMSFEVVDSGAGIPQDQQQELFKPFVQLAQTNSDLKGTGLGLAISKSLIELMDGHISVNSMLGVGSTFKIELSVSLATANDLVSAQEWQPVKSLAPEQPQWRLLIVDDNYDNRLLLETLLTNVGFTVRKAENGEEAIRVFTEWQPHLIWMDMRMPVMDGYEATAKIRQLPSGEKVKIIALTASAFKEQHQSIIQAGCDAVLHKPFYAADIFATLSKYLKVEFIYQQPETLALTTNLELTAEMLNKLPANLCQKLHDAALNLDPEETDILITEIHKIAPDVADALQNLVRSYQFDQIIHFTETANL